MAFSEMGYEPAEVDIEKDLDEVEDKIEEVVAECPLVLDGGPNEQLLEDIFSIARDKYESYPDETESFLEELKDHLSTADEVDYPTLLEDFKRKATKVGVN